MKMCLALLVFLAPQGDKLAVLSPETQNKNEKIYKIESESPLAGATRISGRRKHAARQSSLTIDPFTDIMYVSSPSQLVIERLSSMEILLGLLGLAGLTALLQTKSPLPSDVDYNKALVKLKDAPSDPDANTLVGKYQLFVLGNFKDGLQFLTRSGDATLRTLAEHELAPLYADTPVQKVGLGDEWVAAAKNFKPIFRYFYDRAGQLYAQAYPDLDGIWRDKVRERLAKLLQSPVPGGAVKKGLTTGWTATHPNGKVFLDTTIAHNGGRSMRLEMPRDGGLPFWLQSPSMPAPKGQVSVTAYVATDGTTSPNDKVMLNFYNQAGGIILSYETKFQPDSPYWQRVEIQADVPKNAVKYAIAIFFYSITGVVWVDDVSLKSEGKELLENGSFEK